VAVAIGQSVNIPIIVRTLGHELYHSWMVLNNGFKLGLDLLGYLDGNLSRYGRDDPQLAVEDFHLPWWRCSLAPQKYTSYLSFVSVRACLKEHQKQLVNAVLKNLGKQPAEETEQLNKPAYSWHPESEVFTVPHKI